MSVDAFGRLYLRRIGARYSLVERANHDCIFWENGCTVYEDRPEQCRTFPFWPEFIESEDAWSKIAWCRGKDQGRLYPKDEIEKLARGEGATGHV
jgi:Fe-S-cluster containining protein